jgi:hypothetical protein
MRKGLVLDRGLAGSSEEDKYPCMLYTRTQEDRKTRNVWGYPMGDTIWEQEFFIPWLNIEKALPNRKALLGPDHVDRAMSDLFMRKGRNEVMHCVDFSAYDASIHPRLAHRAFSYIAQHFQPSYRDELFELFMRFISIPILCPEGIITGYHGVPSGSSFTNTVDSLIQMIVSNSWVDNQIQGDDGVYVVQDRDVEKMNQSFIEGGLKINIDKSETFSSHEAIFLQRYYHPNYTNPQGSLGGVYSVARALNRIKYLETWTDLERNEISGEDFFTLRTIMILENCKHHPFFQELVQFAHANDRTDLTYSEAGLKAFSKMQESKIRAGVVNQYGSERGINNFETVKLLSTL